MGGIPRSARAADPEESPKTFCARTAIGSGPDTWDIPAEDPVIGRQYLGRILPDRLRATRTLPLSDRSRRPRRHRQGGMATTIRGVRRASRVVGGSMLGIVALLLLAVRRGSSVRFSMSDATRGILVLVGPRIRHPTVAPGAIGDASTPAPDPAEPVSAEVALPGAPSRPRGSRQTRHGRRRS